MADAVIDTLRRLISFPTTEGNPAAMRDCLDYVASRFAEGFHVTRYERAEVPSLVIANRPGKEFDLILTGHLDVARRGETRYEAEEKDGRVYGDGSLDMKAACAVMLEWMLAHGKDYPKPVALIFTMDEEIGGPNGTGYLLEQGIRAKAVILPDGGYPHHVTYGEKGWFPITCTAEGKPSRGTNPWNGVNALEVLMEEVIAMKKVFPAILSDEDNWHPTCNALDVQIDDKETLDDALIQRARCILEVSYTRVGEDEELLAKMRAAAPRLTIERKGPYTELTLVSIEPDHPLIAAFNEAVEVVTGAPWPLKRENGSSDARYYQEHGIPSLIFQLQGKGSHLPGEWVSVESMRICGRILEEFCARWAKRP